MGHSTPIAVLELSTLAGNLLRRNGITTVEQLRDQTQVLPFIHGCGVGVINEILASLVLYDDRPPA